MPSVDITYVPFPGSAPAINALLGQHVTSAFAGYANVAELIAAGKVRALAVASRARIEPLPDTPTVAESGYKDFEVDNWFGLFAPGNIWKTRHPDCWLVYRSREGRRDQAELVTLGTASPSPRAGLTSRPCSERRQYGRTTS